MKKLSIVLAVTLLVALLFVTGVSATVHCPTCTGTNVTYYGEVEHTVTTYDPCPEHENCIKYKEYVYDQYGCNNSLCYYNWEVYSYYQYTHVPQGQ